MADMERDGSTPERAQESASGDGEVGARPTTQSLASDPRRTHRAWHPRYGRVQKCDFCNVRAPGVLAVCSTCGIRICEHCARGPRWHSEIVHFIDADGFDWSLQKALRKASNNYGTKLTRPSSPKSSSATSKKLSTSAARRQRKMSMREANAYLVEEDEESDHDNRSSNRHLSQLPLPPSSNAYHDAGNHPLHHQFTQHGYYPGPALNPTQDPLASGAGATGPRDNVRTAAARALLAIGQQADHSTSDGQNHDEDSEDDDGADDKQDDDHMDVEDADDGDDGDVYTEKGGAKNVNKRGRRCSNRLAAIAGARTTRTRTRVASTSAAPSVPGNHDNLVLNIYEDIYGDRPDLNPQRTRSGIPTHWNGQWPWSTQQFGDPTAQLGPHRHQSPGYSEYHRDVLAATSQLQQQSLAPPPPGYSHHSFRTYPTYPRGPRDTIGGGSYAPTSRTTPAFHPLNERTPADIQLIQHDAATLRDMQDAWNRQPDLQRLRNERQGLYAIEVLYDVFELRCTRLLVHEFSQTVRWFVSERDTQSRLEHHPPSMTPPQQAMPTATQPIHSSYRPSTNPAYASHQPFYQLAPSYYQPPQTFHQPIAHPAQPGYQQPAQRAQSPYQSTVQPAPSPYQPATHPAHSPYLRPAQPSYPAQSPYSRPAQPHHRSQSPYPPPAQSPYSRPTQPVHSPYQPATYRTQSPHPEPAQLAPSSAHTPHSQPAHLPYRSAPQARSPYQAAPQPAHPASQAWPSDEYYDNRERETAGSNPRPVAPVADMAVVDDDEGDGHEADEE